MLLVDSGASYNFMSSALAKSLGWRILPAAMHVRLANGQKIESAGSGFWLGNMWEMACLGVFHCA